MQKHAISICSYILVASAFGAFARWIMNNAAFETDTGLMIPGAIWSKLAFVVVLLCLGGIVWTVRAFWYQGYYPAQTCRQVIHGNYLFIAPITKLLGAMMFIGAFIAFLIAGYELYSSVVRTLCLLAMATAWAFVKLNEEPDPENPMSAARETLLVALPAIMYAYWLVVSYRTHAAQPSVWSYAVEILAICASMLGTFYFAGYGFDFPRPYAALGCLMAGSFMSLVTILDSRNIGMALMFVAGAGMQLYYVWMIADSMSEQWPEAESENLTE